jgi:hypothetical protein
MRHTPSNATNTPTIAAWWSGTLAEPGKDDEPFATSAQAQQAENNILAFSRSVQIERGGIA